MADDAATTATLAARIRELESLLAASERARIAAVEKVHELRIDLERTQERSRSAALQSDLLLAGIEVMNEARRIEELFRGMLDVLRRVLGFDEAFLLVFNAAGSPRVVAATDHRLLRIRWQAGDFTARALAGRPLALYDVERNAEWRAIDGELRGSICSAIHVPLRGDRSRALLVCGHRERGFFTAERVNLAHRFAGLASQALHNAERTADLEAKNERLVEALTTLHRTQEQLIHAEKMASLGLLVAGIAHEIKNPLNFVNNFAELSLEFAGEIEALVPALAGSEPGEQLVEVIRELTENLRRIHEHGRRADAIVAAMLLHAREEPGGASVSDLNALVRAHVVLAYQGFRAADRTFRAELVEELGPGLEAVPIAYQELSRVVMNLVTNACHALRERARAADAGYAPMLSISTRREDDLVVLRVGDNGTGVPAEIRRRIFDPFFTTKPPGEGTGLGLSICHDIVVKQLGGRLDLDTVVGEGSVFTVTFPLRVGGAAEPR